MDLSTFVLFFDADDVSVCDELVDECDEMFVACSGGKYDFIVFVVVVVFDCC